MLFQAGTYEVVVEYQGDDTTGVIVRFGIYGEEGVSEILIHPSGEIFREYRTIFGCRMAQEVFVKLSIEAPPIRGSIKAVKLYKKPLQEGEN